MKQWIRWSGLIGFISILAILVLGWLFAAGPLIKYSIETFGSKAAKAKVEVADVSLSFDPLGIEISGVQVANSDNPMENVLQFDRAVADLELLPLLLGKGIVNEVALSGVAFSTPRQTSGKLSKEEATETVQTKEDTKETTDKEKTPSGESVSQALPSADELLAREPLLTEQRGREFQQRFEAVKEESNKAIAALPDSKAFDSYEDDFDRLTSGKFDSLEDFKQRKKEFDALKKRIKQDQKAISNAKTVLSQGQKDLRQQWAGLKDAPEEDFSHLKDKYKLDSAGVANLSRLMFGDTVGEWSEEGLYWYEKVKPFLMSEEETTELSAEQANKLRAEGRYIHFKTDRPLPDLLIRKVHLMVKLPEMESKPLGDVAVSIYDITHQQAVINKPITLVAKGQNLNNIETLELNGTLDHRVSPGKDAFDLNVKGVSLKNYNVGVMGLKLDRSQIDIVGNAEIIAGSIDASSKAQFSQAVFSSKDETVMAKEMAMALQKVDRFDLDAKATGQLKAPKVGISSNLDSQLSSAFNQRIKEKQQELEEQLKSKLNDKLLAYAGDYQEQLKTMDLANGSLAEKQEKLKSLAESELTSFEEQQKAEAQRKIDEKRDAERAKAKAKADQKKKDLEKKAKDKLKSLF
jgi:uncharacterized protein (TIGR03545 family)